MGEPGHMPPQLLTPRGYRHDVTVQEPSGVQPHVPGVPAVVLLHVSTPVQVPQEVRQLSVLHPLDAGQAVFGLQPALHTSAALHDSDGGHVVQCLAHPVFGSPVFPQLYALPVLGFMIDVHGRHVHVPDPPAGQSPEQYTSRPPPTAVPLSLSAQLMGQPLPLAVPTGLLQLSLKGTVEHILHEFGSFWQHSPVPGYVGKQDVGWAGGFSSLHSGPPSPLEQL